MCDVVHENVTLWDLRSEIAHEWSGVLIPLGSECFLLVLRSQKRWISSCEVKTCFPKLWNLASATRAETDYISADLGKILLSSNKISKKNFFERFFCEWLTLLIHSKNWQLLLAKKGRRKNECERACVCLYMCAWERERERERERED